MQNEVKTKVIRTKLESGVYIFGLYSGLTCIGSVKADRKIGGGWHVFAHYMGENGELLWRKIGEAKKLSTVGELLK